MFKKIALLALVVLLSGCWNSDSNEEAQEGQTSTQTQPTLSTSTPAVGNVEEVETTAEGRGTTPGAALNEALKTAIMQVNGTLMSNRSVNANYYENLTGKIDVETKNAKGSADIKAQIQGQAFAESIVSQSGGLVTAFKVIDVKEPGGFFDKQENYVITIEAKIARFKAPDDQKIRIIVSPLTSDRSTFNIAGNAVPSREVLNAIRQQMIDTLTNTGRFEVLDRQFDAAREEEFSRIMSGKSNQMEITRLSQELSADLVWIGHLNDFSYGKKEGNWSISQRMINLTTSGIILSSTLDEPVRQLSTSDTHSILTSMRRDIVKRTTDDILLKMFPIAVIKIDGTSVRLNQGGGSVQENARYKVYLLGEELIDPQTGRSLGHDESYCCDIVITRVQPKFSEGVLENISIRLDDVAPGRLQLRQALVEQKEAVEETETPKATARRGNRSSAKPIALPENRTLKNPDDDKDW